MLRAGQGPYLFSAPCWTCEGGLCVLGDTFASVKDSVNLTTRVSVQGGGPHTLAYRLMYECSAASGPGCNVPSWRNTWQATVGSVDGSFGPSVLESLTNVTELRGIPRQLPFNVPSGTRAITITFSGVQVRVSPIELQPIGEIVGESPSTAYTATPTFRPRPYSTSGPLSALALNLQ